MKRFSKILLILLMAFMFIPNVYAVDLNERNQSNNYGVSKNIEINSSNKAAIMNTPFVERTDLYVYDFADLLTDEEEQYIRAGARTLETETNFEIVIYIISDQNIYNKETELQEAANFYDYNDFGINNGKHYDGVMLVINKLNNGSVSDGGYFNVLAFGEAQFFFDDTRIDRMVMNMETDFWRGKYETTCSEFLSLVRENYQKGKWENDGSWYLDEYGVLMQKRSIPYLFIIIISFGMSGIIVGYLVKRNKMVKKAYNATQYLDVNDRAFSRRDDLFRNSRTTSIKIPKNNGGSGGSRGGSVGSSGRGFTSGGGSRR